MISAARHHRCHAARARLRDAELGRARCRPGAEAVTCIEDRPGRPLLHDLHGVVADYGAVAQTLEVDAEAGDTVGGDSVQVGVYEALGDRHCDLTHTALCHEDVTHGLAQALRCDGACSARCHQAACSRPRSAAALANTPAAASTCSA